MNKMQIFVFFTLCICMCNFAVSQVIDSFDDGNFSANPAWAGHTAYWEIITNSTAGPDATGSNTLHLTVPSDADPVNRYLSTQRTGSWGSEQSWGFWVGRRSAVQFDNISIVWLWANESNLESATVDGYRFFHGYIPAALKLQRVENGIATGLISVTPTIASSDYGFLVRITRTASSLWTMYSSAIPTASDGGASAAQAPSKANTSVNHGSATDAACTNFSDGYFGFMAIVNNFFPGVHIGAEFDQLYFDTAADASLPVELSSFTATARDGQVALKWITESEINNEAFILEPSQDGNSFELLTVIEGQGTTSKRTKYSYSDKTVFNGNTYFYRLADRDVNGEVTHHSIVKATPNSQGFNLIDTGIAAQNFVLHKNYPNPFNPETNIRFDVPTLDGELEHIKMQIFNLLGQFVETLYDNQVAGAILTEMEWGRATIRTILSTDPIQSVRAIAKNAMSALVSSECAGQEENYKSGIIIENVNLQTHFMLCLKIKSADFS